MEMPRVCRVQQSMEGPTLHDAYAATREAVRSLCLNERTKPGQTVAVTAGSRGIANIDKITRAVVDELRELGLFPFIVPSMGSHGGATAEGQRSILAHYGITETSMRCPIRSSMDVVEIGRVTGTTVYCDRHAWEADHIAVVARVKAHTDFEAEIESGLIKMTAIGLGKQHGAEHYHRAGHQYGYAEVFRSVANTIVETGHILGGVAVVENGYDQTAMVQAMYPGEFEPKEKALLRHAKAWMARLPFDAIDLLIVDEMGKNISGAGMDPNVTGRASIQKPPCKPHIRQLFVRDLTRESDGNAGGIGSADLTTWRLVKKINYAAMYMNAITSGSTTGSKVPIAFDTDWEAIQTALSMIGLTPPEAARVVRIKNTLHLTAIDVSEALLAEVGANPRLRQATNPSPIVFDATGNLPPFDCGPDPGSI
jgi:hypothetical protein